MPLSIQDFIIYILCFVGLFTSVLHILTLMSPKRRKYEPDPSFRPRVTVIVPVWNEGSFNGERMRKTVDSLLNCNYPKLEIIIVDDHSTDNSLKIANSYKKHGVKVFKHRKTLGKTKAINTGMKHASGELIAGLDSDTYIMPDVLDKLVPCFKDKNVMGAIPSIKIAKPRSFLQLVQAQEFLSATFIRHVQSEMGSIPLAPGAFMLIRKSFIKKYGGYNTNTMVEDLEMSMRIQSENFLIENVINANAYTSGVKTFKAFKSQRIRWFTGFIIQVKKYRHLFSTRYGNLGVYILPISVVYVLLTILVFFYTMVMMIYNLVEWLLKIQLVGFKLKDLFEWEFDLFFLTIDNTTIIPMLLLFVILGFMYYIKRVSEEKQGIILPFVAFTFSYWLLGSYCWVLATYYYFTKKKIKWGPNYFSA